jgi:7-cyano-7-deazaguanine synthase
MFDAVVLLSGGLESVTLCHKLRSEGKSIIGLYFDIGVENSFVQLHYVKRVMFALQSPLEIVDLQGLPKMMAGYMPPHVITADEGDMPWPWVISYLPMLICNAVFYSKIAGINAVHIGITKEQLRSQTVSFIDSIGSTISQYDDTPTKVTVKAPFSGLTKPDVVHLAGKMGVEFTETWSCFKGGPAHCGICASCDERRRAFASAGVTDPTEYS